MSFSKCKIVKVGATHAEYHEQKAKRGDKDFVMSRSELVEFDLNPKRWVDGFGLDPEDEEKDTPALDWGSLVDCLMMGKDEFNSRFAVSPATYANSKGGESKWTRQSKECASWEDERIAEGLTIIRSKTYDRALVAAQAINADPEAAELFKISQRQVYVAGFWTDKKTGLVIPVKILLDLVPPTTHPDFGKCLTDFKTARNGDPAKWDREVDDRDYDVQSALYMDVYRAAVKEDRTDWMFILQENVPPFHIVKPFPSLTEEFLNWGRAKYQEALRRYAECLATGVWPSYRVAGMPLGKLQGIRPDGLWTYRQSAGGAALDRYAAAPEPIEPDERKDDGDIAP